jgi:hypothetical protein
VPRLSPTATVASGATLVRVAVTVPELLPTNGCVTPPFRLKVPVNVSVTAGVVGVVGGVLVRSLLQPAIAVANKRTKNTLGIGLLDLHSRTERPAEPSLAGLLVD